MIGASWLVAFAIVNILIFFMVQWLCALNVNNMHFLFLFLYWISISDPLDFLDQLV